MEIILKQDVETLGTKDQIVNVKPGYANNFLIPQGYAASATKSAVKMLQEDIRQKAHKEEKMMADATAVAAKLEAISVAVNVKANENGKIFGTITTADLAAAISAKGIEVDKKNIKVDAIKELGSYVATVKIYKTIKAEVKLEVVAAE
ncbi:MAG: 50S ribosomal protein L9 [Mucinivorans sp.]